MTIPSDRPNVTNGTKGCPVGAICPVFAARAGAEESQLSARPNGIVCGSPSRYSSDERRIFVNLVRQGGEAAATLERIERAKALATAWSDGRLIGVAALKRPQDSYRAKIATRAGVRLNASEWPFELGYIFVLEEHRGKGLAQSLIEALLDQEGNRNMLATVRTENRAMQKALARFGFAIAGRDYLSDDASRILSLWLRRT